VAFLLADLGVTKTHTRPHTSNDNPYSESHFRTLKYRPDFPATFGSLADARAFCQRFFRWYNTEHRHSGIAWHIPYNVHHGQSDAVHQVRADDQSLCQASLGGHVRRHHGLPSGMWTPDYAPAD
jgi:putative transposase